MSSDGIERLFYCIFRQVDHAEGVMSWYPEAGRSTPFTAGCAQGCARGRASSPA
jgi:hypothetical protein